jgi:repressor LexA
VLAKSLNDGVAPTVRELADRVKMKRSTVHYHLQLLRKAGYVTGEGRHRDLRLTEAAKAAAAGESFDDVAEELEAGEEPAASLPEAFGIPIVGSVAAGQPILAAEHLAGELSLAALFGRKGTLFALAVAGDSMIGDGINDGDYAVVRQQQTAVPGDIVVALIGEGEICEATVKRYREDRSALVLEPSNPDYPPFIFEGGERERVKIVGKLVGLVRKV